LNVAHTETRFCNVFGAPLRLAVRDLSFENDFAIDALDADIGGIHVMSVCQAFVYIFQDSLVRTPITLRTNAREGLSRFIRVGRTLIVLTAGIRSPTVIAAIGRLSDTDPWPAPALLRQPARAIRSFIANILAAKREVGFLMNPWG